MKARLEEAIEDRDPRFREAARAAVVRLSRRQVPFSGIENGTSSQIVNAGTFVIKTSPAPGSPAPQVLTRRYHIIRTE